jgi:DNA polymerase I-like protein with 3'-5' exonuclease and polymerase domains
MNKIATLDFETHAIIFGSPTPPKPVGIAIKLGSKASKYWSWGHPIENNCTRSKAKKHILNALAYADRVVYHNAKFDLSVLEHWMDIYQDGTYVVFDTMIMAFLNNPYSKSLGLKQLADELLNMPPDEQIDLRDWILKNVKEAGDKNWGAFIAKAPAKLVSKYAKGDVDRTYALYELYISSMEKDVA